MLSFFKINLICFWFPLIYFLLPFFSIFISTILLVQVSLVIGVRIIELIHWLVTNWISQCMFKCVLQCGRMEWTGEFYIKTHLTFFFLSSILFISFEPNSGPVLSCARIYVVVAHLIESCCSPDLVLLLNKMYLFCWSCSSLEINH